MVADTLLRAWFWLSAAALVVLFFFTRRQGRSIEALRSEAERAVLGRELATIQAMAQKSEDDYVSAQRRYLELKRIHADLFKRLGIDERRTARPPEPPSSM